MPRTRIKICGVRDVETALTACAAGADAVGLVFVEKSPRFVTTDAAKQIVDALPAFVEPVGLFADHSEQQIRNIAEATGLRTLQLHGQETPSFVENLTGLRIIKALPFHPDTVEAVIASWRPVAHRLAGLLLDTPPKTDSTITGGSGTTFDWQALADRLDAGLFDDLPPIILAGGLNHENVAEAVQTLGPYAVDVSSGVESERGVKDPAKIAAFCAAVRQADTSR